MSNEPAFGAVLRQLRTAAALSQEALAERAHMSVRGISDLERGARRAPHLATVGMLADALGLDAVDRQALLAAARPNTIAQSQPNALRGIAALPVPLTSLVGREQELADLVALLRQNQVRLVTVTGPGGVGKTHLAQEAARGLVAHTRDGAAFVDLAPLRDPSLVLPTVAHVLGVEGAGERPIPELLASAIGKRQMLLVLDNLEQVRAAGPGIAALLAACPRLHVLATSRVRLDVRGEQEYPLAPLALPEFPEHGSDTSLSELEHVPAIALFTRRAQAARPSFVLTPENIGAVVTICRRLDGLPLAIELAAARVRVLPPDQLRQRLTHPFSVLTTTAQDIPARQRTLRDTISWSYELLSPREQTLFRRLAVFAGGWTLDAADAVANIDDAVDVLNGLAALVDASLIRLDEPGAEPRYRMLETIREFALEVFPGHGDEAAVREAHAAYLLQFTEQLERAQFGPERRAWEMRMTVELANLRAALSWLEREGRATPMQRLARAVSLSLLGRTSAREASDWLERALALPEPTDAATRAGALFGAGLIAWFRGDHGAARDLGQAALTSSRGAGADLESGQALYLLSLVAIEEGDYSAAAARGEEATAFLRKSGDKIWLAIALCDTGFANALSGNPDRAAALWEEGIALNRANGNVWSVAIALDTVGVDAEARGDPGVALARYRESLEILLSIDDQFYVVHPLAGIASILAAAGQVQLAARLLGVTAELHETRGTKSYNVKRARDERTAARAHAALGQDRFDREFALGRELSVAEAARQVLEALD